MEATPGDDWPYPDPDGLVGWTLVRAGHAIGRVFHAELAAVGLKPHIFGVLAQVRLRPGMSSAELARHVLVTPQSMGELLRRMARDDLIEYTPPRRGQRMSVHLTAHGSDLLDRSFAIVGAMNRPAALGLTAAEAKQLNTLLYKVLDATS